MNKIELPRFILLPLVRRQKRFLFLRLDTVMVVPRYGQLLVATGNVPVPYLVPSTPGTVYPGVNSCGNYQMQSAKYQRLRRIKVM